MRIFATALLCLLATTAVVHAQHTPDWRYVRAIDFPEGQVDHVRPFQIDVAQDGTIWLLSSTATDITAHNALWRAAPGDATFTLVQDFTAEQVGIVYHVRGLTTLGNNVLVSSQYEPPSPYGNIHYYPGGNRAQVRTLNAAGGNTGYGTYIFALDATDDGMVYATISARPSIRIFDFSNTQDEGFGNWVPMDPWHIDEQAGHDGCSVSALRDLALVPGADYSNPASPLYTSRNQSPSPLPEGCTASVTGRISIWSGGTATEPQTYTNQPLNSPGGEMDITSFIATGITADMDGRVWVTGPDSTRRWVKAFDIIAPLAFEAFELPSATAEGSGMRDPQGAPFNAPVDVALNRSHSHAYVADRNARRVFVFEDLQRVSVEDGIGAAEAIQLLQNHPNPFASSTSIGFSLAEAGLVRLTVYDVLGREVAVLADDVYPAGGHHVTLDAAGLPSGIYVYRLEALGQQVARTLVLSR
jgi:hypothetical protein